MKEIVKPLVNNLNVTWKLDKRCKVTKEKLIECWSEYRKEPDWKFYGYKWQSSLSIVYKRLFKGYKKDSNKESWKVYILRINGYKYCSQCNNLLALDNFTKCKSMTSGLQSVCIICSSVKRKKYHEQNKEQCNIASAAWRKKNPGKKNAYDARRRAAKINRTPSWLTEDDFWMIKEAYSLSKEREKCTGIKWHVDHIIPLQGKLVSGLHVPNNLQVITAGDNLSKSNKWRI